MPYCQCDPKAGLPSCSVDGLLCGLSDPYRCGPCQKIDQMDQKIQDINTELARLRIERQALVEQAVAKHTHEPFIHRLPPEVTARIFKLCVPEAVETMDIPLRLSAICGLWRSIAHSAPQLWSGVGLNFRRSTSAHFPSPLLVREWLDRAGDLSLTIDFHVSDWQDTNNNEKPIIEIIEMFNQCSHRWQSLRYGGSTQFLSHFSGSEQGLPRLHTFILYGREHYLFLPVLNLYPSRLTTLSADGVVLAGIITFDWSNLTSLSLRVILPSECLEALRIAPRLAYCTFGQARGHLDEADLNQFPLPLSPFAHPGIQHLAFTPGAQFYRVIEHLTCPSLKSLTIERGRFSRIPTLVKFLHRSQCPLEDLSLFGWNTEDNISMVPLYQEVSTLQQLHISLWGAYPVHDALRDALAPLAELSIVSNSKQPRYLPSLCSLSLETNVLCQPRDWEKILPDIFGTRTLHSMELHRHFLKSMTVSLGMDSYVHDSVLDEATLEMILWLRDSANVQFKLKHGGRDLIEMTLEKSMNTVNIVP
ncbi:hypothetical protein BDN70DRAFT_877324 [Pholiota conissans]|uniref:F-box domain-containing protein n=1 Tax=Pholiota conissans TaxID=109636 RepID=A0A9P5Z727_9AGAR|nr:hypothetical protein BDN70DRAFT_877324 [Pholiota conissans]